MLRVLVVLPFYGGSLPIGRYCAEALKDIGCLVDVFESPSYYDSFSAIMQVNYSSESLEKLQNQYINLISSAILVQAERFKPDLVLALAQAPLLVNTLQEFKKRNISTAMWFVEDYIRFPYWQKIAIFYDYFAVIQKEPFASELTAIGVKNYLYLPLAALPSIHKKIELTIPEKRQYEADTSFLGAGYANRQDAFIKIANKNFKIWGTGWNDNLELLPYVQRNGERINSEDSVRIYNGTKININLHSSNDAKFFVGDGDFVNPRTFELAACSAFQLLDNRDLLPELFDEDELVTFTDLNDLKEKIDYYLKHPEERQAIAEKAQLKVLKEHTYQIRMQTLIDFIKNKDPNFGNKDKKDNFPSGISDDLKKDIKELLKESKLPEDTNFDDLVAYLRTKSDALSSLEVTILFLDEWAKLYLKKP